MKYSFALSATALVLALSACDGIGSDASYPDRDHSEMYNHGSLISGAGGYNLYNGASGGSDTAAVATATSAKKIPPPPGIGVNRYMWRASLDTVSFMPLLSADAAGGTILTDWYVAPTTPGERMKLNVFIRNGDLTAASVKVSAFRQIRGAGGDWQDIAVSPATSATWENAILIRARQLSAGQTS